MFVVTALGSIVAVPVILNYAGFSAWGDLLLRAGRWPAMFLVLTFALAIIYRYGPSRAAPRWRWITVGSAIAALLWLIVSGGFSWYAADFDNFNATYARRRRRLHDVALDFRDRHSARSRDRRRDGASDDPGHHNRFTKADGDARRAYGGYRRGATRDMT